MDRSPGHTRPSPHRGRQRPCGDPRKPWFRLRCQAQHGTLICGARHRIGTKGSYRPKCRPALQILSGRVQNFGDVFGARKRERRPLSAALMGATLKRPRLRVPLGVSKAAPSTEAVEGGTRPVPRHLGLQNPPTPSEIRHRNFDPEYLENSTIRPSANVAASGLVHSPPHSPPANPPLPQGFLLL